MVICNDKTTHTALEHGQFIRVFCTLTTFTVQFFLCSGCVLSLVRCVWNQPFIVL